MRLYHPKVQVKLIKALRRDEIVPGTATASRYSASQMAAFDLTPHLGDMGSIRTSKSVREPSGGFTITFGDKINQEFYDTVYAMIEPMDLIEIRFCHDPYEYAEPQEGYKPPVIMRGLVSSISRNETMNGGKPVRTVSVAGQDFGKILQIIQIFYLNNSVVGDNILSEFAFFQKYVATSPKIKSAKDFVGEVVEKVINPYLKRLTRLADGKKVGAKVINEWSPSVSIEGVVSPYTLSTFNNVSLYQLLKTVLDVGPFNEMYTEDLEDGIQFTVRPTPFLTPGGDPIQGVSAETYAIIDKDVVSSNLTRTDGGVANYYWVSNSRWSMMNNEDAKRLASVGSESSFILFDYLNSQSQYYGIRKMEVDSALGPDDYKNLEGQKKEQLPDEVNSLGKWLEKRRKVLADINKDNVIFEHGSLRVRGNERIKAGMQLYVVRGSGVLSTYYVVRVDHDFVPYQGFYTNLTVERGTSFIERSKAMIGQYFPEMNVDGVS